MLKKIFECLKKWRVRRLAKPYAISDREIEVLIKYGNKYTSLTSLINSAMEKIARTYSFYDAESTFEEERIVFALEQKWCV